MQLTWNNEDVSIFVPVVWPVSGRAITNGESWSLIANQLEKKGASRKSKCASKHNSNICLAKSPDPEKLIHLGVTKSVSKGSIS